MSGDRGGTRSARGPAAMKTAETQGDVFRIPHWKYESSSGVKDQLHQLHNHDQQPTLRVVDLADDQSTNM